MAYMAFEAFMHILCIAASEFTMFGFSKFFPFRGIGLASGSGRVMTLEEA
jgi:hypothetical protein